MRLFDRSSLTLPLAGGIVMLACGTVPAATAEDVSRQLTESNQAWQKVKDSCGGNYEYTIRFTSWVGFGRETTVVVRDNTVSERRFRAWPARPTVPGTPEAGEVSWSETGDDIGSHTDGAAPKTLDELYADAVVDLATPGPADNCEFIFRGNEQGVMLACYWIDRRIAGDSPKNGVALSALTIEPTAE